MTFNGHGSQVASTVAGNVLHQVPAINPVGDEAEFRFPMVSGVAPHANIVSYQVCFPGNADDGLVGMFPGAGDSGTGTCHYQWSSGNQLLGRWTCRRIHGTPLKR